MTKKNEHVYLLGALGKRVRFEGQVTQIRRWRDLEAAVEEAPNMSVTWIAAQARFADDLLRAALATTRRPAASRHPFGRLLLLFLPRLDSLPALEEFFTPVVWGNSTFRTLLPDELAAVLASKNRSNLFIGGFIDSITESLILYRGDFGRLAVPLSMFKAHGNGPKPDLSGLSFIDHGQTVRLGEYEAAADAILFEADPAYRRVEKMKRREAERSFGASLRRLRILKGLRQSDFSTIPAKTIARIERGEVGRPHQATLARIGKRLGVAAEEIEGY